jgi:MFS transporter, DHA2 family, methylenomycin A resistance protein
MSKNAVTRPWVSLAVVAGGLFLAVMSTTVVSVALPEIGTHLHATATQLEWIVDAYVIVYSSLLVAGGAIGDRRGRRGLFLLGAASFGLGSLVAGLAPSVPVLLAGRAVQGLGPALLIPGSLTIIRAVFEDERRRAVAIGLWSTSSGLALAVGPALGGLLAAGLGWRWVFLFNVPLVVALLALAALFVPRLPRSAAPHRFDLAGAVLTIAAVSVLAFATIEGQARGWVSPLTLGSFAVGGAALAAFVAWERRSRGPLVDTSLLARASFSAANVAAFVVFFAFVGAIVYFSAYFQQVQGRSAVAAGLDVSAIGAAFAVAASQSGRLVSRLGPRWPMVGGVLLAGAATLGLLRLQPDTGIGAIWWDFALLGAGIGMCLTPMTAVSMSAVDASRAGMVSAVHNSLRQVGQVFGVAVLGALVYARLPGGSGGRPLGPAAGASFLDGLHHALLLSGSALLAAAAVAALLTRPGPSALSGSRGRAGRRCSPPSAVPPGPSSQPSSRSRPRPAATRIPASPARNSGSGPDLRRS